MIIRRVLVALSLGALAAVGSALPSRAFDLTGTWKGRWVCQGFDGSGFWSSENRSALRITQTGDTLTACIDETYAYNGGAIPDVKRPDTKGEVALVQKGTDTTPLVGPDSEILRARVKTSAHTGSARFRGVSVSEYGPDPKHGSAVLTCRYRYKRIDTANPNAGVCPALE